MADIDPSLTSFHRKMCLHELKLESIKDAQVLVRFSGNEHDAEAFVHLRKYFSIKTIPNYSFAPRPQLCKAQQNMVHYRNHLQKLSSQFRLLYCLFFGLVN